MDIFLYCVLAVSAVFSKLEPLKLELFEYVLLSNVELNDIVSMVVFGKGNNNDRSINMSL